MGPHLTGSEEREEKRRRRKALRPQYSDGLETKSQRVLCRTWSRYWLTLRRRGPDSRLNFRLLRSEGGEEPSVLELPRRWNHSHHAFTFYWASTVLFIQQMFYLYSAVRQTYFQIVTSNLNYLHFSDEETKAQRNCVLGSVRVRI